MTFHEDSPLLFAAVQAIIPLIEGRPCVHVDRRDGTVFLCRRLSDVHIDTESLYGQCDWVEPEEARPDELTDGLAIGYDCLEIGSGWIYDSYFRWYLIFDDEIVARAFAGDPSGAQMFVRLDERPKT